MVDLVARNTTHLATFPTSSLVGLAREPEIRSGQIVFGAVLEIDRSSSLGFTRTLEFGFSGPLRLRWVARMGRSSPFGIVGTLPSVVRSRLGTAGALELAAEAHVVMFLNSHIPESRGFEVSDFQHYEIFNLSTFQNFGIPHFEVSTFQNSNV